MKNVLCYGDSNVWGSVPHHCATSDPSLRYPEHVRWTSVLRDDLSDDYRVIEEGLSGRTTIYSVPDQWYKCGEPYLLPCLLSHRPLDLVVMMLGTNDLRLCYHADVEHPDKGVRRLIEIIQHCPECGTDAKPPKILLVSPIEIRKPTGRTDYFNDRGGEICIERARRFAPAYQQAAQELGCFFLDAALYGVPSEKDGLHLTHESHIALGHAIAKKVMDILE